MDSSTRTKHLPKKVQRRYGKIHSFVPGIGCPPPDQ
ncbi:hypothetical protein AFLA70_801g000011 [Aspergillus flavus AF70]|nr:hypothetical protein AFLA70_801g000011 [Aspergillus flavus AF70]